MNLYILRRKTALLALLVPVAILSACSGRDTPTDGTDSTASAVSVQDTLPPITEADDSAFNYMILYITVADTGQDYYQLRALMFDIQKAMTWPIDTLNRYYDHKKQKIVVSEVDDDEMYRGEYFPRRYPSGSQSLEYYSTYSDNSTETNIALVTGIYETAETADSSLKALKPYAPKAFVRKANVYVGCMH